MQPFLYVQITSPHLFFYRNKIALSAFQMPHQTRANLLRPVLFWMFLVGALASSVGLRAQSLVFPNFSSTNGLTLNSSSTATTTADGTVLRLVQATINSDKGSAFATSTRTVTSGFSTAFEFRLSNRGGSGDGIAVGADGFVFVIQHEGASAIGGTGEYLGYGGSISSTKILTSVGIEFDTYKNTSQSDPSSNHIGVNLNGNVSSVTGTTAIINTADFDNGQKWSSWIDYNGSTLEVRVSNTGVRPISANLAYAMTSSAFQTTLGNTSAFIGFTAATGGDVANHDIIAWTFSDSFVPGGVTAGSAIPEPADFALLASAAALVAVALRRIRTKRRALD